MIARFHPLAWLRELFAGTRLLLCTIIGVLIFFAASGGLGLLLRLALAWVVGVWAFLGLTALALGDASPERLRRRAQQQDERAWVILALVVGAAIMSLVALAFLLPKEAGAGAGATALRVTLAALTVIGSWLLTHSMFALHYAHGYYGEEGHAPGGLAFPGDLAPDYWDFVYFSFVVGMTCQVSDVQVTTRLMRRLTLLHGVLAFFFNTVILALAVNFLASIF